MKGARNYTSRPLYISRDEMFDDVVSRGLRADGLSTKLGVKNHKDGIGKVRDRQCNATYHTVLMSSAFQLISELFEGDYRLPLIEQHFKTQRQKSNSAKTMFSTMAHEELQVIFNLHLVSVQVDMLFVGYNVSCQVVYFVLFVVILFTVFKTRDFSFENRRANPRLFIDCFRGSF